MINLKESVLHSAGNRKILCASIFIDNFTYNEEIEICLKANHTEEEYQEFLNKLDIEYDDEDPHNELSGRIWFEDLRSWMDYEYDYEYIFKYWQVYTLPEIPEDLL